MADQFDLAQDLDAFYRDQALGIHRKRMAAGGESLTHCIECGDEIPEARRIILARRHSLRRLRG